MPLTPCLICPGNANCPRDMLKGAKKLVRKIKEERLRKSWKENWTLNVEVVKSDMEIEIKKWRSSQKKSNRLIMNKTVQELKRKPSNTNEPVASKRKK